MNNFLLKSNVCVLNDPSLERADSRSLYWGRINSVWNMCKEEDTQESETVLGTEVKRDFHFTKCDIFGSCSNFLKRTSGGGSPSCDGVG